MKGGLDGLLTLGAPGAVLIVRHKNSERFIQFSNQLGASTPRLHFGFPDAPWSRTLFDQVNESLHSAGYSPFIRNTGEERISRFLTIDDIEKSEEAYQIGLVAFDAMDVDPQDVFLYKQSGPVNVEAEKANLKRVVGEMRGNIRSRRDHSSENSDD